MTSGIVVHADTAPLAKLLRRYAKHGQDLGPSMALVAEHLVSAVNDRWDSAGDGQWPPLAASTLANRRGSTAQILIDTGRAVGSVRADSGPDFAEAATDVGYMVFHVSSAPRSKIPLRNPFDLSDAALEGATEVLIEDLARRLG